MLFSSPKSSKGYKRMDEICELVFWPKIFSKIGNNNAIPKLSKKDTTKVEIKNSIAIALKGFTSFIKDSYFDFFLILNF